MVAINGGKTNTLYFSFLNKHNINIIKLSHSYETANGIKAEETGTLKKTTDAENPEVIVAQGSYSYTAPDGQLIEVTYIADDEGTTKKNSLRFSTNT